MRVDVFTLFPHWFEWFATQRHIRNLTALGHQLQFCNYRDHTPLKAGRVDDAPFGGGAGMVLRADVVDAALQGYYGVDPGELCGRQRVIALSPEGRTFDEECARELAAEDNITLLCSRYEGFDERIVEHLATETISIGRFVLSGGELAAMVLIDAIWRKLPGALGDAESAAEESFSPALGGAPEYPHYTRPAEYRGWAVPEVLLSGHHARIRAWRLAQSAERAKRQASDERIR